MAKKLAGLEKLPVSAQDSALGDPGPKAKRAAREPVADGSSEAGLPAARRPDRVPQLPASDAPPHRPKPKLVRDSFTIPKLEYAVLETLKARSIALARPAKKSELLRAGIAALQSMSDRKLLAALDAVPSLKTGRPKQTIVPGADSAD